MPKPSTKVKPGTKPSTKVKPGTKPSTKVKPGTKQKKEPNAKRQVVKRGQKITEAEKAAAAKEAIEQVKRVLNDFPDCQDNGHPFVMKEWPTEYKPLLGPYRNFLETCGHFKIIPGEEVNRFKIELQDQSSVKPRTAWEVELFKSWQKYFHSTAVADRHPEEFVQKARQLSTDGAKLAMPGAAKRERRVERVKARKDEERKIKRAEARKKSQEAEGWSKGAKKKRRKGLWPGGAVASATEEAAELPSEQDEQVKAADDSS